MKIVFTIGIFLSFFLGLLLFTKKGKSLPDKLLSFWLLIIGTHLLSFFLHHQNYWDKYPHLIGATVPFPLLYGPMLFLYVQYSLKGYPKFKVKDFLHFVPALVSYIYLIPFYFFYTAEEKLMVDRGQVDDFGLFSEISLVLYVLSGISYVVVSYFKLLKYRKLIENNFSYNEKINLQWLRYAIIGMGGLFFTVTLVIIFREALEMILPFNGDLLFYSLIILFVFCIGYFGIKHQDIFSNANNENENQIVREQKNVEYKNSGLKDDMAKEKHNELLLVMENKKSYLNPKLTLAELAKELSITPNNLSQIINQQENVNFHDFVNRYRVDEFIHQYKANNQFSILALALDSGFNSKSSFNNVFKKHKGTTPSKYFAKEST